MCEGCRILKEEIKEEIRQLVAGEGELYEELARVAAERFEDEQEREDALDSVVAEGIAQRAAFVAAYCPGSMAHKLPPFVVLGMWAHSVMQIEIDEERERRARNIFGLGMN